MMLLTTSDNPVAELVNAIRNADVRSEQAFASWDAEAYEGACDSASRYYLQLVALVGEEKAKLLVA